MFELSVARKYLVPRIRHLSVSIISLISVFVIAIVVWLSIVFFSAQEGIEKSWTEKMVALTAPMRLTPTQAYYKSYYYQIDSYAGSSNYANKSLREKLVSLTLDPYDPEADASLPTDFPQKEAVDIVKETVSIINSIPEARASIFETAAANLHVRLIRNTVVQQVRASTYLMVLDPENVRLSNSIMDELEILPNEGIILPKSFKDAGVQSGDEGSIAYQGFGATSPQEVRSKIRVAGFYDPGILPIGGKVILVSPELISQVLSASFSEENGLTSGIAVDFQDLKQARKIKEKLIAALTACGLAPYWNVQTYEEYDFTKDIFQQMRSDKNLFSLISVIITIVASSNIISMLIILVRDKRKDVAIMRALGASKASIAYIFGLCGFLLGTVGSLIGALFAVITLHNLAAILAFMSKLQGFEVLSGAFYANSLPSEVSLSSLLFVIGLSSLASCIAGLVPALQASRINTSEALRNE